MIGKELMLMKKARQAKKQIVRQAELKSELNVRENEDLIIVEKSNMLKFLIRSTAVIIRIFIEIVILVFAVIGIAAILYPEPREEIIIIVERLLHQITSYF